MSLKGSNTEENLEPAFSGERQANRRRLLSGSFGPSRLTVAHGRRLTLVHRTAPTASGGATR